MKPTAPWSVAGSVLLLSMVVAPGVLQAGLYPDPACLSACADTAEACRQNDPACTSFGECDRCNNDETLCYSNCPILCSEPKRVYQASQNLHIYPAYATGNTGCYSSPARLYHETLSVWRWTTVFRTEACNGTYVDEVDIYDGYRTCWQASGYGCYGSTGDAPRCLLYLPPGAPWEP